MTTHSLVLDRTQTEAAKVSVGKQKICPDRELRQIDPIWLFGPVPRGFWHTPQNRRNYLLWLGHKLGFHQMRDWYRLTYEDMATNCGNSVANVQWHGSPIEAVRECFPQYDWLEWLFVQVPRTFWRQAKNRRRYMQWLGEQLGFERPDDWYRVTVEDFATHRGGALLLEYRSSVYETIATCFPRRDWKPWLFARSPNDLWKNPKTCQQYLAWLAKRLGIKKLDNWYGVTLEDFRKNSGYTLLKLYRSSVSETLTSILPHKPWCEWKFTRVPPGFWDRPENRLRYVEWLGKQLGCHRVEDWYQVRREDFVGHFGGTLLNVYRSHWDLLAECFPQGDWESCRRQPFQIEQILQWADAYHAEHGKWPNHKSGAIAGTNETWLHVAAALSLGCRGFSGGTTLPRLLTEHRGVRNPKRLPDLTEQQIVEWAKAHFETTGQWPHRDLGRVTAAPEESWAGIHMALRRGSRGLPSGLSIFKLLQKHGLR
jgi:hypothetical protein